MKLFEAGRIGNMEVKNRIVMAAMGGRGFAELDGRFAQKGIDYFVARARGGVGLLTTGAIHFHVVVNQLTEGQWSYRPRVDNVVYVARLNDLADQVHHYGAKIAAQLTAGWGRAGFSVVSPAVAPSPLPCFGNPKIIARELTHEEIDKIVKAFGNAAKILRMAGFDAIELHGHQGFLFDQFKTALWNKRTDEYGGDLNNRLRFSLRIIEEIRNATGDDLPIIYRYGATHYLKGGREIKESQEIARLLEAAGVDALHVDAGCFETVYWPHPPVYQPAGCMVDCAAAIKKVVKIPVIAVGKLGNPGLAEKVLEEGNADFIALGRPLLADPDWPKKAREGKFEDIRPCIGDHDGCLHRTMFEHRTISCTVNPQTGMEREYSLAPADRPRRVLVIGGGPGGLEAARVARLRGHQVALWEKSGKLGGNLIPAATPDFKVDVRDLINYYTTQIRKLGVEVALNKEATAKSINAANPDVAIIATGATTLIPAIAGARANNVVTAIDLLSGRAEVGDRVIVAGGGVTGCEVAVYLAQKGKKVTVIEMMDKLVPDNGVNHSNRAMLLDMVKNSKVNSLEGARIQEINGSGVVVSVNGTDKKLAADSVVLALGMEPESSLMKNLKNSPFEVFAIGDCVKPRRIIDAVWEGFHVSRLI